MGDGAASRWIIRAAFTLLTFASLRLCVRFFRSFRLRPRTPRLLCLCGDIFSATQKNRATFPFFSGKKSLWGAAFPFDDWAPPEAEEEHNYAKST